MNRSILCTVEFTEKQLEPGKLMAKRVSPHPFSLIVTLSRTAQAPSPPHLRPQPPVAAAAAIQHMVLMRACFCHKFFPAPYDHSS